MYRLVQHFAIVLLLSVPAVTTADGSRPLFRSEVNPTDLGIDASREVNASIRHRFVRMTEPTLDEFVTLNLFEDLEITAERMGVRRQLGTTVWTGRVVGAPDSWVVMARSENGATFGKIVMDDVIYQIRPRGGDVHSVLELDPLAMPEEDLVDDGVIPEAAFGMSGADPSALATGSVCDDAFGCGAQTIDIMIVYTAAGRDAMGGTDAGAQATIAAAVDEMNLAMSNSGVIHTYSLVHTALVSYSESGDASADLTRLRSQTDGYMDEVHGWRDEFGADLVSLITATGGCGIGYVGIDPVSFSDTWGFNCVRVDCLTGNLTLAHEVGHNMGLQHDWYVSGDSRPCDWHHGYVNQAAFGGTSAQRWRTVMAYGTQCSDAGLYCSRIPYYSSPDPVSNGDPLGVARGNVDASDAVYALTRTACKVAAYRSSTTVTPPVATFTTTPATGFAPLSVVFDASGSSDEGIITDYVWDFGDGSGAVGVTASHVFSAPDSYTVTLTVTDDDGLQDIATRVVLATDPNAPVDHVAVSEQIVSGSVTGTYLDTHANDGVAETVVEVTNGGKPARRQSFLEVVWRFQVNAGVPATVHANAWAAPSSDGDEFELSVSTDGVAFLPMFRITSTVDEGDARTFPLGVLSGSSVWVKLTDTVREPGNSNRDHVSVDHLFVRTQSGGALPPTAPTGLAAVAFSDARIDLVWTDNASDEDGYSIERSVAGGAWSVHGHVGPDAQSYSDTALNPFTEYAYRVQAFNADGFSTYSNTATVTTGGTGTTAHVGALFGNGSAGRNRWSASVSVTVHDPSHAPVSGAAVTVAWEGGSLGSSSVTTDASGVATFSKGGLKNNVTAVQAHVTDIVVPGGTYLPSGNDVAAFVTIPRPSGDQVAGDVLPARLWLEPSKPNPFRSTTTIRYGSSVDGHVDLTVFDALGRRVRTLVEGRRGAGTHTAEWDGRDHRDSAVPAGIYFYRLRTADGAIHRRMVLLR